MAALTAALVLEGLRNVISSLPSADRDLLDRVVAAAAGGAPALLLPAQQVRLHRLRRRLRSALEGSA